MNINDFLGQQRLVLSILILNTVIAVIYLVVKILRREYRLGVINALFMFFTPPFGMLFMFFSWFAFEILFKNRKGIISLEELSMTKKKIEILSIADYTAALNKVSLEEALIVSDKHDVRASILDILKKVSRNDHLPIIQRAIDHKDAEVSHYAAAAILDANTEFKEREKQLREVYNKNKRNTMACKAYLNAFTDYLGKNILPISEQRYYCDMLVDLVQTLERDMPDVVTDEDYYQLSMFLLDLNENDKAKNWIDKALEKDPDSLLPYKAALKYHYTTGDNEAFLQVLDKLKKSEIVLDFETLDMVRFYS